MPARIELFDRGAAKRGAMPAISFPAIAMSSVSGSCQSASGSIARPPRMISVVPAGID